MEDPMARYRKKTRHRAGSRAAKRGRKVYRRYRWGKRSMFTLLVRKIARVRPNTSASRVRYQDIIAAANRRGKLTNKEAQHLLDLMSMV